MPALSPIVAAAGVLAAGGRASEAVTPALSVPPSVFTPTAERPKAGPPSRADIAFDSTLQPDDLADFIDAAAVSADGPKTLSEIPTRPAALLGLEPVARYSEAKTQPAIRRLPITEQATQAKLNPELLAQLLAGRSAATEPSGQLPASAMPTSPSVIAAVEVAPAVAGSPPAAAAPAAVATAPSTRAPRLDSLPELEAVSMVADLAPPPTPPKLDKPAPPRPQRVSQLIKALQQGQIDPAQALQQASGAPTPTPTPTPTPNVASGRAAGTGSAANVPAPVPSVASGGQPGAQSGPSGIAAPASIQGRVSPGLMPLAPTPPALGPTDSPWGTATQQVVPAPAPGAAPPVGLRGFLLRNQEVMAALLGALLVLLAGIAYLALR